MAADQVNKRSKVSNVIDSSWEMQKAKKKKSSHHDLNTRSSISLEWDGKKEQVVSKKEQISIARRELTSFLPSISNQRVLGDVFAAPPELFELENLTGLLSYEVWETQLSLQEREFLTQFLPEGSDPHKAVYELLAGNSLCFGTSFLTWGASVCSGGCHPDGILRQEQRNKANKIAYYSELHEYHTKMIGTLQLWKERWASCVDPENDFMRKILSSREGFNKRGSLHENGIQYGPEEVDATSGSCSWDADDKLYSSDSPNLAITNGETLTRVSRVDVGNKYYDSSGGRSVARLKKGDKLRRLNVECGDGAKYMSYIKVSKEQHERVKSSMRHSNTSIQPRSLNHVLGNLDGFCVQPYEVFEEEERQKLHDHWSNLAKKDLHVGFENWKSWRSAKWQVKNTLIKEMEDKWKSNDQPDPGLNNQYEENSGFICLEQNDDSVFGSEEDLNAENHETSMQIEHRDESGHDSAQNQHLIHNDNQNFCPMAMDANNEVFTESNAFPSSIVEYPENINHVDTPVDEQFPLPSAASELWLPVSLPTSVYYHQPTSVSHEYSSINESSLRQAHSSFLHRRSNGGESFFNSYANQDRNELILNSFLKDPVGAPYLHEQKLSRLAFHPTGSDAMLGTPQFPRNLCSSMPLGLSNHSIEENLFADGGGRLSLPRQEHLLPLDHVQDWPVNGVNLPMPASSSHHQLNQNWFSNDVVVRDGWSGGVAPHQDIRNSGQVGDESLYDVLSQCNGLRSGVHLGSTGAVEQFVQSGNYVRMGRGPVLPITTNVVPSGPSRGLGLNYMNGNEAQLGWMNLPRALQETGGKSFPRLWNDKDLGR